ncbi:hypothetical protein BCR33DRAFT_720606 [Rhizoclosmatium globosum]|uniref:Uncharacterized protein n=1 Tax=Rhizoclosmatium globosum TaxID=329046 RepID=A0A1Y2BUW7_9FUNG|nr:hypothetical protein BCR33DRAFT_720606 [Rhizoclosmatium globosum]|eukprot:ORY38562.1 hypothetical protein BCR33DRAFT_720606 [Rhizoclosmatium globosum]
MAPPHPPSAAIKALPYIVYLIVFAASVGVCVYYKPRLPDPFENSHNQMVSVASQFGILLGISGAIFVGKFVPLVVFALFPHHNTHKHTVLKWTFNVIGLNEAQKHFWLEVHPKELARIEAWVIVDALFIASPIALGLLGGFWLEFVDGASGDKSFPASKYWLWPHVAAVVGVVPCLWMMWVHGKEIYVQLAIQPTAVPMQPLQQQQLYGSAQPQYVLAQPVFQQQLPLQYQVQPLPQNVYAKAN